MAEKNTGCVTSLCFDEFNLVIGNKVSVSVGKLAANDHYEINKSADTETAQCKKP